MLDWAKKELDRPSLTLDPLQGDASFRQYFRLQDGKDSWIIVHTPPEAGTMDDFIRIQEDLKQYHIPVPALYAIQAEQGWLIQEDLGSKSLFDLSQQMMPSALYQQAFADLASLQIQSISSYPAYDTKSLWVECERLMKWWATLYYQDPFTSTEVLIFENLCQKLINEMQSQPQIWVHRDFHSRNLMVQNQRVFWIDFQDGCIGPLLYDVVSLGKDAYLQWSDDEMMPQLRFYYDTLTAHWDKTPLSNFSWFIDQYHWTGLQRHIKILGIFARLAIRDQKPHYLQVSTPILMHYIAKVCEHYDFCAPLLPILQRRLP